MLCSVSEPLAAKPALETVFRLVTTTDPLMGEAVVRQSVPPQSPLVPDGAFYVGELTGFPFSRQKQHRLSHQCYRSAEYRRFYGISLI